MHLLPAKYQWQSSKWSQWSQQSNSTLTPSPLLPNSEPPSSSFHCGISSIHILEASTIIQAEKVTSVKSIWKVNDAKRTIIYCCLNSYALRPKKIHVESCDVSSWHSNNVISCRCSFKNKYLMLSSSECVNELWWLCVATKKTEISVLLWYHCKNLNSMANRGVTIVLIHGLGHTSFLSHGSDHTFFCTAL